MTYMIRRRPEKIVVSCSPGGCGSCLLYLICSCWGFYTCVLDNWLRHCHLKKAPTETKDLKPPEGLSGSWTHHCIALAFFFLSCSLSAFLWRPRGCAVIMHITAGKMKGGGAGGARTGGDPWGYRQPHCFCNRATWNDLMCLQHVQYALSVFLSVLYLGPGSQRREISFVKQ